jgi:hypothetical protein
VGRPAVAQGMRTGSRIESRQAQVFLEEPKQVGSSIKPTKTASPSSGTFRRR